MSQYSKKWFTLILLCNSISVVAESRLANIATRGFVGTGDNVLIGGLVISGTEAKTVVIRARGPSLAAAGVSSTLSDPALSLFSGSSLIDSNNDWLSHQNSGLVPLNLQPSDPTEAVILRELNPGAYTAIVTGVGGGEGIAIIEVFELSNTGETRLINIATRGLVGTEDNVLIGGLVISGTTAQKVVIRAKGPSLAALGVSNVLADPQIILLSGASVIDSNDNWQTHARASEIPTELTLTESAESAILIDLAPGAYTAIVQGVANGTGIGIVEVFEVAVVETVVEIVIEPFEPQPNPGPGLDPNPYEAVTKPIESICTDCENVISVGDSESGHGSPVDVLFDEQADDEVTQWGECIMSITTCADVSMDIPACVASSVCPQACKDSYDLVLNGATDLSDHLETFLTEFVTDGGSCVPAEVVEGDQ